MKDVYYGGGDFPCKSVMELDPWSCASWAEEGGHHEQQSREKGVFSIVAAAISESITTKSPLWHMSALALKKKDLRAGTKSILLNSGIL